MTLHPSLKWTAGIVLATILLPILLVAIFGWNWLRGPIERMTLEKTGRVLAIHGDLAVNFAWPAPRLRAESVSFANPPWAKEPQMLTADAVEIDLDLAQLLRRKLVFPEVALRRPVLFLEQSSDGRKNWLLDRQQQDEEARIHIGLLALDQGKVGFDDTAAKTRIRAEISTPLGANGAGLLAAGSPGLLFSASGEFRGLPLKASGSGGPVLALRDETTPYPLKIDARIGGTRLQADGTITSLIQFSALDMRLALGGDSLERLFPLLGIAFPQTRAYAIDGHLLHSGSLWRYEKFSGRFGASDIAGSLQVEGGGKRPALQAELVSNLLDLDDLGPLIGSRLGSVDQAVAATVDPAVPGAKAARVLPDQPFNTERWNSLDAEVKLTAKTLRRAQQLALENLSVKLSLRDSVLTLDPLDFGIAGGQLNAVISLDGRQEAIQAHAKVKARKIQIARLFPATDLKQTGIGQINGEFDLAGQGKSVAQMLANSSGKLGLVVVRGEISRLMMEKIGLHLWEIVELKLSGDHPIKLRCAVADFDVKAGRMSTDALVFDTEITTILGNGSIDLAKETLDLTLNQKTKSTSPLALRSPIHIGGSFAQPDVQVDKTRAALRGLGALTLGIVNPVLALLPLIDAGPGEDSDCRQLIRDARALPRVEKKSGGAAK
jgi:AsmA protein